MWLETFCLQKEKDVQFLDQSHCFCLESLRFSLEFLTGYYYYYYYTMFLFRFHNRLLIQEKK